MNTTTALISLFKTSLTDIGVWGGTIPENADVPAIAVYNVAFANDRVLSGKKTKRVSTWRITLVDTTQNLQNSIDQIESIDNIVTDDFNRIWVELSLIEPKALTEPHQRAFFDITIYPK